MGNLGPAVPLLYSLDPRKFLLHPVREFYPRQSCSFLPKRVFGLFRNVRVIKDSLIGGPGCVVDALEPFAVYALRLANQHLARTEVVREVRPHLTQFDQILLQLGTVETDLSEEPSADGAVLLLHVGVVVALTGA